MSKAGKRLIEGVREALAIARGEQPAASVWVNGYEYVPADRERGMQEAEDNIQRLLKQAKERDAKVKQN